MPLATPSNITVSRLYRVAGPPQRIVYGQTFGPASYEVFGNISWTNSETSAHAVILTVGSREILLTTGASSVNDVRLAVYQVPEAEAKTTTITVQLKSSTESSATATLNATINGHQTAAFSGSLSISGNNMLLPNWTGAVNFRSGYFPNLDVALGGSLERREIALSSASTPLGGLIENQIYRARFTQSSKVNVATDSYSLQLSVPDRFGLPGLTTVQRSVQFYEFGESIASELFFGAPVPVVVFTAQNATFTARKNAPVRRRLEANYRATWAITSGNPGAFGIEYVPANFGTATGPDEAYLVGTPTSSGSFTLTLTGTRADAAQTAAATVNMTVVDSLPRTVITSNSAIAREGVSATTADTVNIALESTPSPATWTATGLPPGVTMDAEGKISGRPTRIGTYFASITATAENFEVSLPTTIKFTVTPGELATENNAATLRSTWLLLQWELTDLHVIARSRDVQSTLFAEGGLRIKLGDAINFAVFFVDSADTVFALAPSQLRLTIRKADNLDDLIIFKSASPPTSATQQGQTYYLMPVTTGNREREVALQWVEDSGKNDPLPCVADLDWIKDGKTYSSRTFPVLLELDVTRP